MKKFTLTGITVLSLALLAGMAQAGSEGFGWRGNLTGLFPDAQIPATWSNVSTGPMEGMKYATAIPAKESDSGATRVEQGLVKRWLTVGPIAVEDSNQDFDKEQIPDEAKLAPREGDKLPSTVKPALTNSAEGGSLAWKAIEATSDGVSFWNVNLTPGKNPSKQVGYFCTCLYATKAGKIRAVVEHVVGMKIYVNGKQVYSDKAQRVAMASAYGLSRCRVASTWPIAPSFEFDVVKGWNRMTVKLVAPNGGGWNDLAFMMRLADAPGTPYQRKNIVWMTPLPDHGNATPIVVGNKVFIMVEPDELICVDKNNGKILWSALNNSYEATPPSERSANPAFKDKIDPLAAQLKAETNAVKRWELRRNLQEALVAADKAKYTMNLSGHLAAHFEIVGFSTTPVSDGKSVYAWMGAGVAAGYDLDGKRKWIRQLPAGEELHYSAAPAVGGGRVAVFHNHLYGLDAKTGAIAWEQPAANSTVASLLAASIAGTNVFITQKGDIVRASDGKMLWNNPSKIPNDTGWAAPVVSGDVIYLPWYGLAQVHVIDCAGCTGDEWKPKVTILEGVTAGAPRAKGDQGDEWTAGSPLIHNGTLYDTDIHSRVFAVDLKTGKQLWWHDVDLPGESNYVALRMAASPALIGKFIVVMDNQGNAVTFEPGVAYKELSRNRLATQIQRDWAMTTQELIGYSPPVADGTRMYLHGERYLYCIGEQGK